MLVVYQNVPVEDKKALIIYICFRNKLTCIGSLSKSYLFKTKELSYHSVSIFLLSREVERANRAK